LSTLAIDNFKPSAGGTSFGIEGIAKAGASYDQSTPSVDDSYNVSSITDNGTGDWSLSFTNNMAAADYATLCGGCTNISDNRGGFMIGRDKTVSGNDSRTTTGFPGGTVALSNSVSNALPIDIPDVTFAVIGTLA